MRNGTCTAVLSGDTIVVDGNVQIRYTNVWAPTLGTPLGDACFDLNRSLVLDRAVEYQPNGHLHWDGVSMIADVYLEGGWVNQQLRLWLSRRLGKPLWVGGIPGGDNETEAGAQQETPTAERETS
ncbi:MAG: hypothetical protein AAB289_04770 [Chloroflexota bacterium]|mgnify:FL=1